MDFDRIIDRRGTHSMKWDMMAARYGVSPEDGISMWVADMDFRPPACVQQALEDMLAHGVYGYFGDDGAYRAAIRWWMANRHGWQIAPDWIATTHGLVNGTALCLQTWTQPGDGVIVFTPVYHAFAMVIRASGRRVVEIPLVERDGRLTMDFPEVLPAPARMILLCSPHNPGGQVWTPEELRGVAEFARRHDLILVSDEIHHDLVLPGHRHTAMPLAAPDCADRLVMMTATTKTFNIAGAHIGNVIIPDPSLRAQFQATLMATGTSPNSFGMHMATAAYSPQGAEWVDALCTYLDGNRQVFEAGVAAIPGVRVRPLQATYLEWVDFTGTGMSEAELCARIEGRARIAANHGTSFGTGGAGHLRFNIATPRARVVEAVERLQEAFADLQ
jgi:cysteine-S-conjugate beta-lyase